MNRRTFLASLPIIAVGEEKKKETTIQQGVRELKDITPNELEELLKWCDINLDKVITVDERDEPSLHPKYQFTYISEFDNKPVIVAEYYYLCSTMYNEWDEETLYVSMGDISVRMGPIKDGVEAVRWFLERGFKVL